MEDIVGHVYGNSGNGSEEEKELKEPYKTNNIGNGNDKKKNKAKDNQNLEVQKTKHPMLMLIIT